MGKDIILYHRHSRQTQPLVSNVYNRKKYWFIEIGSVWKYIPFKTTDKRKFKIMYLVLNWIQPKYIMDINWISTRNSLYKIWTSNNSESKFIVLQHGCYAGGKVVDASHKYTNCDIFVTWGTYFVNQFKSYNSLKDVKIINFGNSIYNGYDRTKFKYKDNNTNKILLLPTALNEKHICEFYGLTNRLNDIGFKIFIKEHRKQGIEKDSDGKLKYPAIEGRGIKKITGSMESIYPILEYNDFDFIIADHSTSLLDAIFFKNKVIYFDPNNITGEYTTHYSKFLKNLYSENLSVMMKNNYHDLINIENQESLFTDLITSGNNRLDTLSAI